MLPETTLLRLRTQLDTVPRMLAGAPRQAAEWRPASGKWTAREQLAHIARLHPVTLQRVELILAEAEPQMPRYRAEEDPEWPRWAAMPLAEVTGELTRLRPALIAAVTALPPAALERRGVHAVFGHMSIAQWMEFFVLHEAHHLYWAFALLRSAPRE